MKKTTHCVVVAYFDHLGFVAYANDSQKGGIRYLSLFVRTEMEQTVGDEYGQEGKEACEADQEEGGDVRDE